MRPSSYLLPKLSSLILPIKPTLFPSCERPTIEFSTEPPEIVCSIFRFDNSFYYIPPGNWAFGVKSIPSDLEDKDQNGYYNWYKDENGIWVHDNSELFDRIGFQFRYKTNLQRFYNRPNYSYKIEFNTSFISFRDFLPKLGVLSISGSVF